MDNTTRRMVNAIAVLLLASTVGCVRKPSEQATKVLPQTSSVVHEHRDALLQATGITAAANALEVQVSQLLECRDRTVAPGRRPAVLPEWQTCGRRPLANSVVRLSFRDRLRNQWNSEIEGTTDAAGRVTFDLSSIEPSADIARDPNAVLRHIGSPDLKIDISGSSLYAASKSRVEAEQVRAQQEQERNDKKAETDKQLDVDRQKLECVKGNGQSCLAVQDFRHACQLKIEAGCVALREQTEAAAAEARAQRVANAPVVMIQDIMVNPRKYADSFVKIRFAVSRRFSVTNGKVSDQRDSVDELDTMIAADADDSTRTTWLRIGMFSRVNNVLGIVRIAKDGDPVLLIVGLGVVVNDTAAARSRAESPPVPRTGRETADRTDQPRQLKSVQHFRGGPVSSRQLSLSLRLTQGDTVIRVHATAPITCNVTLGSVAEGVKQVVARSRSDSSGNCEVSVSAKMSMDVNYELWSGASTTYLYEGDVLRLLP